MSKELKKDQTLSVRLEGVEVKLSEDKKTGVIKGYASVYDNLNCYGFYIAKGAYSAVL